MYVCLSVWRWFRCGDLIVCACIAWDNPPALQRFGSFNYATLPPQQQQQQPQLQLQPQQHTSLRPPLPQPSGGGYTAPAQPAVWTQPSPLWAGRSVTPNSQSSWGEQPPQQQQQQQQYGAAMLMPPSQVPPLATPLMRSVSPQAPVPLMLAPQPPPMLLQRPLSRSSHCNAHVTAAALAVSPQPQQGTDTPQQSLFSPQQTPPRIHRPASLLQPPVAAPFGSLVAPHTPTAATAGELFRSVSPLQRPLSPLAPATPTSQHNSVLASICLHSTLARCRCRCHTGTAAAAAAAAICCWSRSCRWAGIS